MLGATREVVKKQKDYFFNLPKQGGNKNPRLKLRIENSSKMLIYYERPNFTKSKNNIADIKLYSVIDNELLYFLKHTLGIKSIVYKKREIWRIGNTVFNLDTVRGIGNIFEIELQKNSKPNKKDIDTFNKYKKLFLPYLGKIIKSSNGDIVNK